MDFIIDSNICTASTLPGRFYTDPHVYNTLLERTLAPSWQLLPLDVKEGQSIPTTLLPGSVDEPIIISRDQGNYHCFSNVCTHRAAILLTETCEDRSIRCRYHGRRFKKDGTFLSMPNFTGACDFPSERENLPKLTHANLGPLQFVSLEPKISFQEWAAPLFSELSSFDWSKLPSAPQRNISYTVNAHWALYCDNYLEGLHVPFVHPSLNRAIRLGSYETKVFPWGTLQTAESSPRDREHIGGKAAYYFWLYPNLMLNIYPWGLSVNRVLPLSIRKTRVEFHEYIINEDLRDHGAGGDLDTVEMEDEEVVELVQKGIGSRLYKRGRFSPQHEKGVHAFHQLLADDLTPTI